MTSPSLAAAADRLRSLGVRRVESFAWRDLDDADGGGSELHADEILRRWADHGIDIEHRTSRATRDRTYRRHGYRVVQHGGRFDVFVRVALRQTVRRWSRRRPRDVATIEIWNGVPWFGPIWGGPRRIVWLHHVHRDMWDDALPLPFNALGRSLETRIAPLAYRHSTVATLSESSAEEIRHLGIPGRHLTVIPPGVHERFSPAPERRDAAPHVVVVGRLASAKRQRLALAAVAAARRSVPDLTVELIGDGPDRTTVEEWIHERDAGSWASIRGRVSDDELLDAYRRAWLVVSTSHAEGWGMSLTEGGACGTPCVATDIAGHRGAAVAGVTGLLVGDDADLVDTMGDAIAGLLRDADRRAAMGRAAIDHAASLSWSAVATRHLDLLCDTIEQGGATRGS